MDIKELLERRKREIYGEDSYDTTMENFGDVLGDYEDFGDITLEGSDEYYDSSDDVMSAFFSPDEIRNIDIQATMIEDPDAYIDEVIEEATNSTIELIGESYINDLILENALFDCETAEEIEAVEESVKTTVSTYANKAVDKIKELWGKFTAWMKNLLVSIKNQFTSGEKLVSKYGSEIKSQYEARKDSIKIKSYIYKIDDNGAECLKASLKDAYAKMDGDAQTEDKNLNKEGIKKQYNDSIGAKDGTGKKDIKKVVASRIRNDEKKEIPLSSLNIDTIMHYANGVKTAVKNIKEMQKTENDFFKEQISTIKNLRTKDDDDDTKKLISTRLTIAKQGSSMMSMVIKTYIGELKSAHRACTAIVKKLLNKSTAGGETETKLHRKIKKRL